MFVWLVLDWEHYGRWRFLFYTCVHTLVWIPLLTIHSYINIRLFLLKGSYLIFIVASLLLIVFSGVIAYYFYPVISEDIITYDRFFVNRVLFFSMPTLIEIFMHNRRIQEQLNKIETQQEIIRLNQQTGPHLFFNTLSTLQKYIIHKSEKAEDILIATSDLMRHWLTMGHEMTTDLTAEIRFLENYIALEKMRLGDKIAVDFIVQGDAISKKILSMLLIVFIENAFKYGSLVNKGQINIVLLIEDTTLYFQIDNPNPPPNYRVTTVSTHTGLDNIRKRLHLMYSNNYFLETAVTEDSFRVNLSVPIIPTTY
jgi:LytS/YehU family sensor histidine kinase